MIVDEGIIVSKERMIKMYKWYFSGSQDMVNYVNDILDLEELEGDKFKVFERDDFGYDYRQHGRRIRAEGKLIKPKFVSRLVKWIDFRPKVFVVVSIW
ncbi:MAG: hypothetical protein N2V78_09465 [Methanophagales archaeon]|nr:hypothetical protein [Methanophagales archaeon]